MSDELALFQERALRPAKHDDGPRFALRPADRGQVPRDPRCAPRREQDEVSGLDLSQHSENAYVLGGLVTGENVGASREERGSHKEGARVGALGKGS